MKLVGSYPLLYWHQIFTVQNLSLRISVKKSGFYSSFIFMKQELCSLYHDFVYHMIACTLHMGHVMNPVYCFKKSLINCV
jgi:hypothetical protein